VNAVSAADFPAMPYPGARPDFSFVQHEGAVHQLSYADGRWVVGGESLDAWLAGQDAPAPPTGERDVLLAYGSNACPAKIEWLRTTLQLPGPVVVLRAWTTDLAAVWAAGLRVVDDQRPATLAASPGTVEQHAVWLITDAQREVLDRCEGRGERYQLARLHTGRVQLENGDQVDTPLAYVGLAPMRMPLLVDGATVRCATTPQADARALRGAPAESDGLNIAVVG
jgi:hypothetical protein